MSRLQPRFLGALQRSPLGLVVAPLAYRPVGRLRLGMGASISNPSDANLVAAASLLESNLAANGCQQTPVAEVSTFQSAWNAAGGTPQFDGSPGFKIDGLYGANTQAALQAEFTAANLQATSGGSIVPGCVAQAPAGGGTTPTVVVAPSSPAAPSSPTQTVTVGSSNLLPLAIAGVAGAGLIGWAIYAKKGRRAGVRRRPAHRTVHHRRLARRHR